MQAGSALLNERYELQPVQGSGDTGAVLATDGVLRCTVLVSAAPAPAGRGDERATRLARFHAEARQLAMLTHPNLVKVTDWFDEGDKAWLVTAVPDGETMAEVLAHRAVDMQEAAAWTDQLAAALQHLHEQQPPIFLRLLVPANVTIADDGRAILGGFDLTHTLEAAQYINRPARRGGDTAYAPPELHGGGSIDARSDIWSLGALMYAVFTGHRPPKGADEKSLPSPRTLHTFIPTALERVIVKAMAVNKTDRFQGMSELRRALAQVPKNELQAPVGASRGKGGAPPSSANAGPRPAQVLTRRPGPVSMRNPNVFIDESIRAELEKPVQRNAQAGFSWMAAVIVGAMLVLGGGGGWWYKTHTQPPAAARGSSAPSEAQGSEVEEPRGQTTVRDGQKPGMTGISIAGIPSDAKVTIDDKPARAETDIKLQPGSYRVRIEANGYMPYSNKFLVRTGEVTQARPKLERLNQAPVPPSDNAPRGPVRDVPVQQRPQATQTPNDTRPAPTPDQPPVEYDTKPALTPGKPTESKTPARNTNKENLPPSATSPTTTPTPTATPTPTPPPLDAKTGGPPQGY